MRSLIPEGINELKNDDSKCTFQVCRHFHANSIAFWSSIVIELDKAVIENDLFGYFCTFGLKIP